MVVHDVLLFYDLYFKTQHHVSVRTLNTNGANIFCKHFIWYVAHLKPIISFTSPLWKILLIHHKKVFCTFKQQDALFLLRSLGQVQKDYGHTKMERVNTYSMLTRGWRFFYPCPIMALFLSKDEKVQTTIINDVYRWVNTSIP